MTRREKIIKCIEEIENGYIKLQEHVWDYGTSRTSELLAWLCVEVKLALEKELEQ